MREYSLNIGLTLDSALLPDQIDQLVKIGVCRNLPMGEFLYHQGDAAHYLYLLLEGRVKTFMVNSGGQEALLRIHLPGSLLGLTTLTTNRTRDANATAIDPSKLAAIRREDLQQLVRLDPDLGISLIQLLVDRLSDFHMRVGELSANSVEQRLARGLLSLSRPDTQVAGDIKTGAIMLTHEELAQLINSRRQTVTAVLSRFAQAGLIRNEGRRIVITNHEGLSRLIPE